MPSSMNWVDGAAGGTPVSAANLNKLAVVADIGTAGTPTGDAVRATSLPKWAPNTAYAAGEPVLNPSGQTVTANTAFTSGSSYSAGNWTIISGGGAAVSKWQPSTAYTSGDLVLSPLGKIVRANSSFTSGSTYNSSNWTPVGPFLSATDFGVVADGTTDQTTNFATWIAALKALSIYGVVGVLPASNSSYVGQIVLAGNYGIKIVGYGAKLTVPDGGIGIDVQGALGGSALGWKVEGLLIKGATTNTTGVRVTDSTFTTFRDTRIEDVNTGWLLRVSSSAAATESTTIVDCYVQHCAVGVDMVVVTPGGSSSFDQTFIQNLGVNKATVAGVRIGTGINAIRMMLDYTTWVDTGGCVLDTDADMTGVFGRVMGEAYVGAVGPVGIRPRANSFGWDKCNLETRLQGSLSPQVDTTVMAATSGIALREGNRFLMQGSGLPTTDYVAWLIQTYSQSFPVIQAVRSSPLIPGGSAGFMFGTGTAAPDTYLNRPSSGSFPRLESNAYLTVATTTSGTRQAPSAVRDGTMCWDSTLRRMVYSDSVNWIRGNGITTKTANYTITRGDIDGVVLFNGTSLTATLPTAASWGAGQVTVKNINASTLTLATTSSQTIDGAAPGTLAQWASMTVVSDGANWFKI